MPNEDETHLSELEAKLLHHEAFVSKLLRQRKPPEKPEKEKKTWLQFFESSGGTAFITVVLGTLGGALISSCLQAGATERAFQQSWLSARGDQAMVAYKEFVEKREDAIKRILDRVGNANSSAEDYITLSKRKYVAANYEGDKKKAMAQYRESIKERFEKEKLAWRTEQDQLAVLIGYYYPNQTAVTDAWKGLGVSLTAFIECAQKWHETDPINEQTELACFDQKDTLRKATTTLTAALEVNKTYLWAGWEDPDKLRQALNK